MKLKSKLYEARSDQLGLALLCAGLLHALIILGLRFEAPEPTAMTPSPVLEITLVPSASPTPPVRAEYLAQANQDGSGNTSERLRPQAPPVGLPVPIGPATATPIEVPSPQPERRRVLTRTTTGPAQVRTDAPPAPPPPAPSGAALVSQSLSQLSFSGELAESIRVTGPELRHKRISAATREYKYASYMVAWIAKVERIGNLNYPDEARRARLSGQLLLDVALNSDGSINTITLLRSSGQRALDDAAIRIVRLAAPFAPFPPEVRSETDVLHILRTWEFLSSNQLHGQ